MISGFVKVFKKLDTFRFEGSFEGWVKRIMIRESISYLRKNQFVVFDDEVYEQHAGLEISDPSPFQVDFIQKLIDQLPEGYKMVFVLFAVEGYSHAEIAKLLNISENTSKSQLYKARRVLQKKLNAQEKRGYGTH